MKKQRLTIKLTGWILMIIFMLPIVAKSFHEHEEIPPCCQHSDKGHTDDSCDTSCPVCHFTYSLFTEAEYFQQAISESITFREPAVYLQEKSGSSIQSYHLRAPPVFNS